MERGRGVRSKVADVPAKGRTTMGVVFAKPDKGDRILLVTTGQESEVDEDEAEAPEIVDTEPAASAEPGGEDGGEISAQGASAGVTAQDDGVSYEECDKEAVAVCDTNQGG